MTAKQKKNLLRILLSAALIIALHFVPVAGWPRFLLYMIPYLIIGYDILIKAFKGLVNRQPFDECFLMAVATIGAIALGLVKSGDYTEAVAVMLFYQIGEWFQSYAVGKSRRSISDLMDIRPDYANIEGENGELTQVDPDDVEIGTTIVVQPGEKVPIDGVVLQGTSSLDTAALTGESMPRDVAAGDEVISGCINLSGLLKIRTTKEFEESTASKILELIEDAGSRKSKSEDFITKFARIYTPAVVYAAIALAVLPPLLLLALGMDPAWGTWAYRALTFLVVSCPCALVISIPLSFFAGIGGASKEGILVKGSNYLEILSQTKTVVFDKTGTLTRGKFAVTAVHPERLDQKELLHMAAHVERYSTHPIAAALREAYPDEKDGCSVEDVTEIAGRGIRAKVSGKTVCVGNARMMEDIGAKWKPCEQSGTIIHVAIDGEYEGHIVISDVIKEHSAQAIRELKKNGVTKTVMLTGDAKAAADQVASKLSVDEVHAELLPADKVAKVEELIASKKSPKDKVAFVGDGINDAPVLARADIGIAMGAMGSDAAIEAADIVLMDDDPLRIVTAIRISRKCLRIVRENIWFAIGVKLLCLLLTAVGIGNMWLAIFADVGVMIIAVLNAVRCLHAAK
ncbi:MAG: heavy metal translocating P-type ATPase [Lachnospiraceae bacterium]|nr:heavy metal translocating P-type ATPase [Lachnospiraceae bacterium]